MSPEPNAEWRINHISDFTFSFKIISDRIRSTICLVNAEGAGKCCFKAGSRRCFLQLFPGKNLLIGVRLHISQTKIPVSHSGEHPCFIGWKNRTVKVIDGSADSCSRRRLKINKAPLAKGERMRAKRSVAKLFGEKDLPIQLHNILQHVQILFHKRLHVITETRRLLSCQSVGIERTNENAAQVEADILINKSLLSD